MTTPRSLGLVEAAALLRVHKNTLAARARARIIRHTWATWHIQNGTPTDVPQKLGAWNDERMVKNYAHHSPGYLAQFANNVRKK